MSHRNGLRAVTTPDRLSRMTNNPTVAIRAIRELNLVSYWRYVLSEPRVFKSGLVHGRIYKVSEETGEITETAPYKNVPTRAMSYDVGCELNQILKRARPTVDLSALPTWATVLLTIALVAAVNGAFLAYAILSN
jgi:hypothetical protein